MNFTEAIILGAIQGFTEWLPISSSAHIFLVETYFGLTPSIELAAWLHGGSLLAALVFYRKHILEMLKNTAVALKIILATLVSVPIILLLKGSGALYGLSIQTIALTLAITGIFILASEYLSKKPQELSWTLVVFFGIAQGLAAFPGISRAGITIALLILLGVAREKAVDFSFLAAIPILSGALLFTVLDIGPNSLSFTSVSLWVALVASFAASVAGIHYMRKWVESRWLWFAPYCFGLAGLLIIL